MPTLVCTTSRTSIAKRWASAIRVGSDASAARPAIFASPSHEPGSSPEDPRWGVQRDTRVPAQVQRPERAGHHHHDLVVSKVHLGAADARRSISSQGRKSGMLADRETPPHAARKLRLVSREVGPRPHALILSAGSDRTIALR